jgi:hypothetical protein
MHMKLSAFLCTLALLPAAATSAQTYKAAAENDADKKVVTITGEVVRLEPGKVIVIRDKDRKEVTYTLLPSFVVPVDVQVGKTVTVYSEPGTGGTTTVTRITTTSLTPEGRVKETTEETRSTPSGEMTTRTTTVSGEVVKYEPGRTIVVRQPDRKVITYTLNPELIVPAEVQVGKTVTLYTEPSAEGGTATVKRVTLTTVTPEGQTKQTTEETRTHPSGATTTTTTTTVSGKVEAFTAGKSITVLQPDGTKVTYTINTESIVPADLVVGKTITLVPINSRDRVVRTITIVREP